MAPLLAQQNAPGEQAAPSAAAPAGPPQTNCDVSGEWSARSREDTEDRVLLGTNPGDYTGFPLNEGSGSSQTTGGIRRHAICCPA